MKGERMKNRMRASDQVQLAQKNTLNDGPLLKRHQAVQAVAWDGPQGIFRLHNGLILSREEIKRAEPELREQIMANSERGFEPGLVCAGAGIWAEPVNHEHIDDTHNIITNLGATLVADMIQSFISDTDTPPANTPTGMVLGSSSTAAAATDQDIDTRVYAKLYNTHTANSGVVTLISEFAAPGGSGISNIQQVAQMVVLTEGQSGSFSITANTASSIIDLSSTINLSATTSLDVTVTWTVSDA